MDEYAAEERVGQFLVLASIALALPLPFALAEAFRITPPGGRYPRVKRLQAGGRRGQYRDSALAAATIFAASGR